MRNQPTRAALARSAERSRLGYTDLDNLARGCWRGDWIALLTKALDVEVDRFLDQFEYLLAGFGCGNTAGKVRDICPEAGVALFDDH